MDSASYLLTLGPPSENLGPWTVRFSLEVGCRHESDNVPGRRDVESFTVIDHGLRNGQELLSLVGERDEGDSETWAGRVMLADVHDLIDHDVGPKTHLGSCAIRRDNATTKHLGYQP